MQTLPRPHTWAEAFPGAPSWGGGPCRPGLCPPRPVWGALLWNLPREFGPASPRGLGWFLLEPSVPRGQEALRLGAGTSSPVSQPRHTGGGGAAAAAHVGGAGGASSRLMRARRAAHVVAPSGAVGSSRRDSSLHFISLRVHAAGQSFYCSDEETGAQEG